MSGHSVFLVKANCCVYFWRIGGNYGEVDQTLFATAYNHDRGRCLSRALLLSNYFQVLAQMNWIWPILQVFDMFAMESKDCLAELEAGLPLLGAIQSFLDCLILPHFIVWTTRILTQNDLYNGTESLVIVQRKVLRQSFSSWCQFRTTMLQTIWQVTGCT